MLKNKDFVQSFNNAFNGIMHVLKNERNLKIHFIMAIVVLFLSLVMEVSRTELIILIFCIALVIICEIINTSIEEFVDVIVKVYHPKAKVIKDAAAGAVLVATVASCVVGYLVFVDRLSPGMKTVVDNIKAYPPHIILIALLTTICCVLIVKTVSKTGSPFRGGLPSGHAAVAFSITTAIALWSENMNITVLCLVLALLVAQSRVEGKIHTVYEVFIGALVGVLITVLIFKVFWPI